MGQGCAGGGPDEGPGAGPGPPITMALITLRSRQPTPLGMGAPTPVRHEIINPDGGQTRVPGPVGVDPDDGHLLTDHARNEPLAAIGRPQRGQLSNSGLVVSATRFEPSAFRM